MSLVVSFAIDGAVFELIPRIRFCSGTKEESARKAELDVARVGDEEEGSVRRKRIHWSVVNNERQKRDAKKKALEEELAKLEPERERLRMEREKLQENKSKEKSVWRLIVVVVLGA